MTRTLIAALAIVAAAAQSGQASPQTPSPQPAAAAQDTQDVPTFRSGTELVTLDVSVLDGQGRPVQGLAPSDFTVEIDGEKRRVTAAELVKADVDQTAAPTGAAATVTGSTAAAAPASVRPAGRKVLIAVDQGHIPPGSIKPLLNAASAFIDRLTSRDQAGFVAFPEPGPRADFTNDKAKVRKAMEGLIGQPRRIGTGEFDVGIAEALTIYDKERFLTNENNASSTDPPVVSKIMDRGCSGTTDEEIVRCRRQILSEASQIAQDVRNNAKISIRTLESIIDGLVPLEGTKSLVLISASLTMDTQHDLDGLIRLAEAARMSFHVILVDVPPDNKNASRNVPSPNRPDQFLTDNADRRVVAEGLEELAADGRGSFYRFAGSGTGIFDSIALRLSASYVLGVEARPADLTSDLRKVNVSVRRQGARVRVSQAFVRTPAKVPRTLEETFRDALAQPVALTELPVKVATFLRWEPRSDKVRVSLTMEIGEPGIQAGDYVVGYVITDQKSGAKVVEWSEKQSIDTAGRRRAEKPFGDPVLLTPGVYSLRMALVDGAGRRGTVVREVNVARSLADDVATSDLVVGNPPAAGEPLAAGVEPHISGDRLAAYLELYAAMAADLDWTRVTFEIAQDADSPPLSQETADVDDGALPAWRVATGFVDTGELPAGRYVARARVVRDGKTLAVMSRPFVLERSGPDRQGDGTPPPAAKSDPPQ